MLFDSEQGRIFALICINILVEDVTHKEIWKTTAMNKHNSQCPWPSAAHVAAYSYGLMSVHAALDKVSGSDYFLIRIKLLSSQQPRIWTCSHRFCVCVAFKAACCNSNSIQPHFQRRFNSDGGGRGESSSLYHSPLLL